MRGESWRRYYDVTSLSIDKTDGLKQTVYTIRSGKSEKYIWKKKNFFMFVFISQNDNYYKIVLYKFICDINCYKT